ncbi:hypothetical protein EC973_009246 [Apophysomyces ossiformis]|uniref:Uncharacterized protein n=1 Tax=Apophysomyces ossiformis TaxID=679940 RepID=A0A8H7BMF1_9FUNG|nr:hypothetical protein EC973_009246 [Apophysomyces ossiformis]
MSTLEAYLRRCSTTKESVSLSRILILYEDYLISDSIHLKSFSGLKLKELWKGRIGRMFPKGTNMIVDDVHPDAWDELASKCTKAYLDMTRNEINSYRATVTADLYNKETVTYGETLLTEQLETVPTKRKSENVEETKQEGKRPKAMYEDVAENSSQSNDSSYKPIDDTSSEEYVPSRSPTPRLLHLVGSGLEEYSLPMDAVKVRFG